MENAFITLSQGGLDETRNARKTAISAVVGRILQFVTGGGYFMHFRRVNTAVDRFLFRILFGGSEVYLPNMDVWRKSF